PFGDGEDPRRRPEAPSGIGDGHLRDTRSVVDLQRDPGVRGLAGNRVLDLDGEALPVVAGGDDVELHLLARLCAAVPPEEPEDEQGLQAVLYHQLRERRLFLLLLHRLGFRFYLFRGGLFARGDLGRLYLWNVHRRFAGSGTHRVGLRALHAVEARDLDGLDPRRGMRLLRWHPAPAVLEIDLLRLGLAQPSH